MNKSGAGVAFGTFGAFAESPSHVGLVYLQAETLKEFLIQMSPLGLEGQESKGGNSPGLEIRRLRVCVGAGGGRGQKECSNACPQFKVWGFQCEALINETP